MKKTCPCGLALDMDDKPDYKLVCYNRAGQVVFAVCSHDVVIIDQFEKRDKELFKKGTSNERKPGTENETKKLSKGAI